MQTYTVAVLLVGIIIAIISTSSTMGLAIDCEASPNIRRICEVLVAGTDLMGERCKPPFVFQKLFPINNHAETISNPGKLQFKTTKTRIVTSLQ